MKNTLSLLLTACLGAWPLSAAETAHPPASAELADENVGWSGRVKEFLTQDYLLGTWRGIRPRLSERGVDFEFFYVGAVPSNLSGGKHRGSVYEGLLAMMLDVKSDRLLKYEGGHFHASSLWVHGEQFSSYYIGDFNRVSLIDFPATFRLWELWYEHKLWEERLAFKGGQLAIDQDFLVPIYSKLFVNQTFFFPTLAFNVYDSIPYVGNHGLAATPYGAPGARLRFDVTPSFYVQAGVYDGNPDVSYSGTRLNLNADEGALVYYETGIRVNQEKGAGLPGVYKLGGYYHTDDYPDNYETIGRPYVTRNQKSLHEGNWGLYFLADQALYREIEGEDPAEQGLGAFFRLTGAPPERNPWDFGIDAGFVYKGLIPGRDYDSLGFAASYLKMSDDIAAVQRVLGVLPTVDYEAVLEWTYKAQVTAWWTLQPSLQWAMHPGGRFDATADAWAIVFLTTLRF